MIRRLLIANRGEIAIRITHACRELGIETVAMFSKPDQEALHVRAADRAIEIGAGPATESYLSIPRVVEAARTSGADAIHPGYGFLSENAAFAAACEEAGLTFVGPPSAVIAAMGSKIQARELMKRSGVPVVPGETPADQSDEGVQHAIERVGLPVLVKASAGGGGKGMRRVDALDEAADAIRGARREAESAFGDGTLYIERLLERPRHVEVQVFADSNGHTVHLFERECSIQRRHQKVIEESPSPALTPALRAEITASAVAAARAAGYRNAGTIEFLVEHRDGRTQFFFLEMNTRLQVEHPVTEAVTGVDLVRAQLLVASGEGLPWSDGTLTQRGHAIEARVYAEDPAAGFLPQAGRIVSYREPNGPGIRVDSGVTSGSDVPVYYDPLLAKVIAYGETRQAAVARLREALETFTIGGIRSNLAFLRQIIRHPRYQAGDVDTSFLDQKADEILRQTAETPEQPAAIPVADPWDARGRWGRGARAEGTGGAARGPAAGRLAQNLEAPMPAKVLKVLVHDGDEVKKGDTVVLLEAMKMELPVRAASAARVHAIHCREGELVDAGALLVEME